MPNDDTTISRSYDKNTILTKDDFIRCIDSNLYFKEQLLDSAKRIIEYGGLCFGVQCSKCFIGYPGTPLRICKRLVSLGEIRRSIKVNYAGQFIKLYTAPKTHHIDFMENG